MEQMFVWAMIQREFISTRNHPPERNRRMPEHRAPGSIFQTMRNWLER
jgi:hypothetical protein